MLKILRKKEHIKKVVFWILIVVCVFAFVLWGIGANRQSSKITGYAGEINGHKIPIKEFLRARSTCLTNAKLRFGENLTKILPYLNIDNQAWTQLILLQEAKKSKFSAQDEEVIKAITNNPIFSKDNKFNQGMYNRIVQYYFNIQPREFEEQTRSNLIIAKLYEEITKEIKVKDEEVRDAYEKEFQTLTINYIRVKSEDFKNEIKTSDEELNDYYKGNLEQFRLPEMVNVEYIGINYQNEMDELGKTKIFEQVKSIYYQIKKTGDFKKLAKNPFVYNESGFFSSKEPVGGIGYSDEFNKYAFSLKEKEISPIIQARSGVYVLRVIQKKASYIPDFTEVKEKTKDLFLKKKANEEAKKETENFKSEIDEYLKKKPKASLAEIGKSLKIEAKTTEAFKRQENIPGVGTSKELSEKAFALGPNKISDIIETPLGNFIIEQNKLTNIDEEKFKQEKEDYRIKLLESKKQDAFNKFADELLLKANLKNYLSPTKNN